MVEEQLVLSNEEVSVISDLIDDTIMELVPTWKPNQKDKMVHLRVLLENDSGDSVVLNNSPINSGILSSTSLCSLPQLSLLDKYQHYRLNMELESIVKMYHQRFLELLRMNEEAMREAENRWMTLLAA